MASILDNFSTLNLTPEELKKLALRQGGGALAGAVEGEFIPRGESIGQDRPRIGADPVSAQEQSRVGPRGAGRTFYANTAGDVGTSVPRGSGTSGIYEAAAEQAPKAGRGLLRTLGKAAGPVGVLADVANPEMLGDGELTPEQQNQQAQLAVANMGPQMAGDAWKFGQDVAERTLDAGMGRRAPLDLRDPQQPRTNYFDQSRSPRLEESPMGPVAEANPQTPQQAAGAAEQQKVGMQQQLADQSLNALNSGELTRKKAAEAVVQADVQRSGKDLTPSQQQEAVKDEVSNMRGMDNQGLSKYLGIALVAGGLLASVMDKSGKTADMFAQSMNKQMDRELQGGIAQRKQDAATAKAAQDQKIKLAEMQETARRNDMYGQSVNQTGQYQEGQLGLGGERNDIAREGQQSTNAYRGAKLGIQQQGLLMDQARLQQQDSQFQQSLGLKEKTLQESIRSNDSEIERRGEQNINDRTNLAIKAKAVALQEKGQLPKLSTKEAEALLDETYSGQGVKLNGAARTAMAQQLRRNAAQDPTFFENPSAAALRLGDQSQYETGTRGGIGWLPGINNTETRVKKRKTQ